jgi:hypothetical protein
MEAHSELHALRAAYARHASCAPWPRTKGVAADSTLSRAELELLGVHHCEIARVLSRAVKLLERRAGGAPIAAFQKRAAGAVAAARDAGAWVPSAASCVARLRPTDWPSKLDLARAAFELDPSAEHDALLRRMRGGTEA